MQSIITLNKQRGKQSSSLPRSSQQSNSSIYSRMLRSNKALSQEEDEFDTAKNNNQFADLDDDDKLISGYEPQNILDLQIDPIEGKRYLVKYKDASYKLCTWQNAATLQKFGDLLSQFNKKLSQGLVKLGQGKKKYKKAISRLKKRDQKRLKVIEDQDSRRVGGDEEQAKASTKLGIRKKRVNQKKGSQQPKVNKKSLSSKAAQDSIRKAEKNSSKLQLLDEENKNLNQNQNKNNQNTKIIKNKDSQQSQQTTTFNPRQKNKKFRFSNSQGYISSQSSDSQLFHSQSSSIFQGSNNNLSKNASQDQLPVVIGDQPQKVGRIWQESDGRVFVRVQWKQMQEGKIMPTIYGIESYPPAGYKLLMNFLVAKYKKAMKWD